MRYAGVYFDGKTSGSHAVELEVTSESFLIFGLNETALIFSKAQARFLTQIGSSPLTLEFADQSRFLSTEPEFQNLKNELRGRDKIHWLESRWKVALSLLLVVIAAVFFFYHDFLPIAAKAIAFRVPKSVESKISEQTMLLIDKSNLLGRSKLSVARQFEVQLTMSQRLATAVPGQSITLLIRYGGKQIKSNAFALPNGNIYVTDELIEALTPDELFAVLCHELGHVQNHHGVRSLIETSMTSAILFSMSGNVDWTGLPLVLMTRGYSRSYELEADQFSVHKLQEQHLSTNLLGDALQKIDPEYGKPAAWYQSVSTHPTSEERIQIMEGKLPSRN